MKGTVLVIDDEPQLRNMMADWLIQAGCDELTASNGEEGLVLLIKDQPDIAVSDIWMPEMDGYQFCRMARDVSDAAIVLMSGVSSEIEVLKTKDTGADLVLTKPFGMEDFLESIDHLLEKEPNDSPAVTSTNALHAIPPITQERALLQYFRKLSANNKKLVVSLTRALESPHGSNSQDEY